MKELNVALLVALVIVSAMIEDAQSNKMTIDTAKRMYKNLRDICAEKTNTPDELIDGQSKGEFPKDERLMCFMKCIMTTTKSMRNDEIQFDWMLEIAPIMMEEEYIPRVEQTIGACRPQVTATDGCEAAWQLGKCIYETDSEFFMSA